MQEGRGDWMAPQGLATGPALPNFHINYLQGVSNKILKSSDDCEYSGIRMCLLWENTPPRFQRHAPQQSLDLPRSSCYWASAFAALSALNVLLFPPH